MKYYIQAMRLRTLPLSLAGVCLGLMLAAADYNISLSVAIFTILTTLSLQILSNIANELGDALSGTDDDSRLGPRGALAQGDLSERDYKVMIKIYVILSLLFGTLLIYSSFGTLFSLESLMLMILGVAAIKAAISYTLGKKPYGYRGWGDVYVFIFFGIISVLGSYFVATHTIKNWILLLPAASIGFFSVGVLNTNNLRDMKTDVATRTTIPLKIGEKKAKIYQIMLILLGWVSMLIYTELRMFDIWHYLFIISLPLFIIHLIIVCKKRGKEMDQALPLLVFASLLFSLLSGAGYLVYLLDL